MELENMCETTPFTPVEPPVALQHNTTEELTIVFVHPSDYGHIPFDPSREELE